MIKWLGFVLLLIVVGCNRSSETTEISKPIIDFSTPDNLIKSTWKFAIWTDTTRVDTTKYELFTSARIEKEKLWNMQRLEKARKKHPSTQNTITDVQVKSESYAIVEAKEYDEYSEKATDVRYILSREQGQWKIDDCFHKCSLCGGLGMLTDYSQMIKNFLRGIYNRTDPKKECEYCKGTGWAHFFLEPE